MVYIINAANLAEFFRRVAECLDDGLGLGDLEGCQDDFERLAEEVGSPQGAVVRILRLVVGSRRWTRTRKEAP